MKIPRSTWIAIAVLIAWLVLAWYLGSWLGLRPPALYYLRGGLWLLGFAGFAGFLLLGPKQQSDAAQSGASAEIEYNFAEALKRMRAARGVKQLGTLPAVFLIGDSGSAKTSVLAKSGIEPELLAGHAYQEHVIAPTRTVNLWFARETLFIDPAGNVIGDPAARKKLVAKFPAVRINAIMAAKTPPARTVVFTVDCETFLQAGGAEALAAKARQFQTILSELSQQLGSSFPVYVLFTKTDKIPYFRDFVENFTEAEASEIFGVTLPLQTDQGRGVYAEQQTRRLTEAFQDLYYSLCDKRPNYLAREHDAPKLPNIYEFPREFAKLRPLLVQFLVDLCRPSQLGTTPFLRGFYFTGVRPVTMTDLAPAVQVPEVEEQSFDAGATRIFTSRAGRSALVEAQAGEVGARKVPQWVFLGHLFSDVILADRPAATITQQNVKLDFARRLLLGAVSALALLIAVWWIVSYSNNRALVREAVDAARTVSSTPLPTGQLASLDSLQRLTQVKNTLARLNTYHKQGAPLEYGAFLYAGDAIREPLRATYYALFRKLLLAPTQQTLIGICDKPAAYDAQGYSYLYNALKAYLITTDHPKKSTVDFLSPVLLLHWQQDQQVDEARRKLAAENFEFYAADLPTANPYPSPRLSTPDSTAVDTARDYLKRSKQEDRIYQALLGEAGKGQKPVIFNVDYPGSAETVRNSYRVDPAYTKGGYARFRTELEDPNRFLRGEEWVLGEPINAAQDRQQLKQDLSRHYDQDFVKTWQAYLNATSVVGYQNVPDAAIKLDKLSSPDSSLLRVFCLASENTAENKAASEALQPVQFVTPPGCSQKLVAQANNPYMQSLIALKTALQTVGRIETADPNNVTAANTNANQAETTVSNLRFGFTLDPGDPKGTVMAKTTQLLDDPIARVPPLLKGAGAGPVNGAAGGMCAAMNQMFNKYPFNPKSTQDATLEELNTFLKPPDGQLWQFVNNTLKQYVVLQGTDYAPAPGQQISVTPVFLRFLNHAKHMSDAIYKGGPQPNLTFAMQPLPTPDVSHVTLTIDGQTLSTDLQTARPQNFTWPGTQQNARLLVRFGAGGLDTQIDDKAGTWAIWHLLDTAERWLPAGSQYQMEWVQKTSAGPEMINGHTAAVKFSLDPQGSQVFAPHYFSGMSCPSKAVQ
ncbi:MAG: hypothetical protein JO097_13880 [Acidobacteriaceae bacterium]|nr:hypothetical protein [Acidobacteriaceae bacterium]MBV9294541.1 hypothetical protein [Acidobacteriaceae bacterium]MBV9765414.1 hypothetical protein [Acidobacteriaceae bacterium]